MKKRGMILLFVCGILAGLLLAGTAALAAEELNVQLSAQPVYVDGRKVDLTAYNINGSNYIKLRDVGQAVNFNVYWDGAAVQVESAKPYTGEAPAAPVQTGDIGQEKAFDIALAHAGFTRAQVVGLWAKQDYENGVLVYEVEFYVGATEYEYDINAATGEIVKWDKDYRD